MVKTQIQLPDHLHREAKRIAAQYEMSFAEVVRRGLERLLPAYPPRAPSAGEWRLPLLDLGLLEDPFAAADWRAELHIRDSEVAEPSPAAARPKPRKRAR
jgi:hypothetical protein